MTETENQKFSQEEIDLGTALSNELTNSLCELKDDFVIEKIETVKNGRLLSEILMGSAKSYIVMTMIDTMRPDCAEKYLNEMSKELYEKYLLILEYRNKREKLKQEMNEKGKKLWG